MGLLSLSLGLYQLRSCMNSCVRQSIVQPQLRGKITLALSYCCPSGDASQLLRDDWGLLSLNDHVNIDYGITVFLDALQEQIERASKMREVNQQSALVLPPLRCLLALLKKMKFYGMKCHLNDRFTEQNGLYSLYRGATIQTLQLLSRIHHYDTSQPHRSIILNTFRETVLKLTKQILKELKEQIYCPSDQLSLKIFHNIGLKYNREQSHLWNTQAIIAAKTQGGQTISEEEELEIEFTVGLVGSLGTVEGTCRVVNILKDTLMDKGSGALAIQYQHWAGLYQACLKLYCRHECVWRHQLINIDQLLTAPLPDQQFPTFVSKEAVQEYVSLESLNCVIKNSRTEQKEQMIKVAHKKALRLGQTRPWRHMKDLIQCAEISASIQADSIWQLISDACCALLHGVPGDLLQIEQGLSNIFENPRCANISIQILTPANLQLMMARLEDPLQASQTCVIYKLLDGLLSQLYGEGGLNTQNAETLRGIFSVLDMLSQAGYVFSKSVFKLLVSHLNKMAAGQASTLWRQLVQVYLSGSYEQNSDLEIIHSHPSHKEALIRQLIKMFPEISLMEIQERQSVVGVLAEVSSAYSKSYLIVKAMKDEVLVESLQTICINLCPQLPFQPLLRLALSFSSPLICNRYQHQNQTEISLLSIICEEFPIETLKFIFQEINFAHQVPPDSLLNVSLTLWSHLWRGDRRPIIKSLQPVTTSMQPVTINCFTALTELRKMEMITGLMSCVFDKLNEHSQVSIKEIKMIYEVGCQKLLEILPTIHRAAFTSLILETCKKSELIPQSELALVELLDDDQVSLIKRHLIQEHYFLNCVKEFNFIGKTNHHVLVSSVNQALYSCFVTVDYKETSPRFQSFGRLLEVCLMIENSWVNCAQGREDFQVDKDQQWAAKSIKVMQSLLCLNPKPELVSVQENCLYQKIVSHVKILVSKQLLPGLLDALIEEAELEPYCQAMKGALQMMSQLDVDYQDHFIILLQKIERRLSGTARSAVIWRILELFFELTMKNIRIRSFHIFRLIKFYMNVTSEPVGGFNRVIAQHIKLLMNQFTPIHKSLKAITDLSNSAEDQKYSRFHHSQHSLTFVECACTLSMFINLFSRLNYSSLSSGVEQIFLQNESRMTYLDYLISLSHKLSALQTPISSKELQIMKIDVFGNLPALTKGKLSGNLVKKLLQMAQELLKVRVNLSGISRLPIKLIAEKVILEHMEIDLSEFEEEEKALSLGVISLHRKIAVHVRSNLHLCNIWYLSSRQYEKAVELNNRILILGNSKAEIASAASKVKNQGIPSLFIYIAQPALEALHELMTKLVKYFKLALTNKLYLSKCYALLKILLICLQNNPQIINCVMQSKIKSSQEDCTLLQLVLESLRFSAVMFTQFYVTMLKTNGGFVKAGEAVVSLNLQLEVQIRNALLQMVKGACLQTHPFLMEAVCLTVQHSEQYRFRSYKFAQIDNEEFKQRASNVDNHFGNELTGIIQQMCSLESDEGKAYFFLTEILLEKAVPPRLFDQARVWLDYQVRTLVRQSSDNLIPTEPIISEACEVTQANKLFPLVDSIAELQKAHPINRREDLPRGWRVKGMTTNALFNLQENLISASDRIHFLEDWETNPSENKTILKIFAAFEEEIEAKSAEKDVLMFEMDLWNCRQAREENENRLFNEIEQDGLNGHYERECDGIIEDSSCDMIMETDSEGQLQLKLSQTKVQDNQIQINTDGIELDGIVESANSDRIFEESVLKSVHSKDSSLRLIQSEDNQNGSIRIIQSQHQNPYAIPSMQIATEEAMGAAITKSGVMVFIEEYTLNPEALKQIAIAAKRLDEADLKKLLSCSEGPVKYIFESELKSRGTSLSKKDCGSEYDSFYIDESKLFEGIQFQKTNNPLSAVTQVPILTEQLVLAFFLDFFTFLKQDSKAKASRMSNLLKKLLLQPANCLSFTNLAVYMLTLEKEELSCLLNGRVDSERCLKILIDQFFSLMIESRIGLPIIFFAEWQYGHATIEQTSNSKAVRRIRNESCNEKIMSIIFGVLIRNPLWNSTFLQILGEYTNTLQRIHRYNFPYYELHDKLTLSGNLGKLLSQQMHATHQSLSQSTNLANLLRILSLLELEQFSKFLAAEMQRASQVVRKVSRVQTAVLKAYRKNYVSDHVTNIQRRAEIYWQLRKSKEADDWQGELEFSRLVLSELASDLITTLQENCFLVFYRVEDNQMRNDLARAGRAASCCSNFAERQKKQQQFRMKEKEYICWRKNLMNQVIKEEIDPVLEFVSEKFLHELIETEQICLELSQLFGEFAQSTPIIFRQAREFYKMMLSYDLLTQQQEHTLHSMSVLKTNPSIYSIKDTVTGRKRSTLKDKIHSFTISLGGSRNLSGVLKRVASYPGFHDFPLDAKDPLFCVHGKYSHGESKIKLLHRSNSKGLRTIQISRQSIWLDTMSFIDEDFGEQEIRISITGQMGIDYGGLTREWITLVAKEVVNPDLGLFELSANKLSFQPSRHSYLVPNHLVHFYKFGQLVGKAMKENWLLEINFTKSFLKHLLGFTLYVEDLDDIDPYTQKSLMWILNNDIGDDMGLCFAYDFDLLGQKCTVELIPNGSNIPLLENNKRDYVKLLACARMTNEIRSQSKAFMAGIEKIIPYSILKLFTYKEIGRYLAGFPTVDILQMQKYARYEGVSRETPAVKWFWSVLENQNEEQKAAFLFFLTGSYKVPYSGFKDNPITINLMIDCLDYLPVAHTCFSIIDLPEYSSRDKLKQQLETAVSEGKGFSVS